MDGYKKKKKNMWRGNLYSDTRYSVIKWLERELPKIAGDKDILNIAAGNWPVPEMLLTKPRTGKYFTTDLKHYGDSKNNVRKYCDAHDLPKEWDCRWDVVMMNQALECMKNPFKVASEIYRVLKPGGVCLIDTPFNVSWFGYGAYPDTLKKTKLVSDYWRVSPQGLELLLGEAGFKENKITIEHSGPNSWDPYCIFGKAIK